MNEGEDTGSVQLCAGPGKRPQQTEDRSHAYIPLWKKLAVLEGVTGVLNQSLVLNGKIIPGQFIHRLPLDLDVEASPGLQITTPDF